LVVIGAGFFLRGSGIEGDGGFYKKEVADLDNNQTRESYSLEKGRLTIAENSKVLWQSPKEWLIDDFILADVDNDGRVDINLSLWKRGNFGAVMPFWIKKNEMSLKNHFFVLNFGEKGVREVWGSSNLSQPNCEFQIADMDSDDKNELIVIEGSYGEKRECRGEYLAIWEWDEWGFSNKWRSEKGEYSNLRIEKDGNENKIVAEGL